MDPQLVEVFVPGRVCLLGEHTDWAVLHRGRFPGEMPMQRGHCLVYGTNCGVYARAWTTTECVGDDADVGQRTASRCSRRLTVHTAMLHPPNDPHLSDSVGHGVVYQVQHDGSLRAQLELPLSPALAELKEIAASGSFFSYVAGTVVVLMEAYPQAFDGAGPRTHFHIDNYLTDLPVGKGLSSSAAICVLVVRAMRRLVGLALSEDEEMELAYQGERRTPSRCGRMDQCVAHGVAPISMRFDGDGVQCTRIVLPPAASFHFVVADMNRSKDTQRILSDLEACFTGASDENNAKIMADARHFLGQQSQAFVVRAMEALAAGSAADLGAVFVDYQHAFDACLQPVCPSQLSSPRLHELLQRKDLQQLTYGGKGVGSQGDGSIQFVCRGEEEQRLVKQLLDSDGCHAFAFTLSSTS